MKIEYYITKDTTIREIEKFQGFIGDGEIHFVESMPEIMIKAGYFKTVKNAIYHGWGGPIPDGSTQLIVGKRKKKILFILNKTLSGIKEHKVRKVKKK